MPAKSDSSIELSLQKTAASQERGGLSHAAEGSAAESRATDMCDAEGRQDGSATIWLDGNVLACACPECGAPMSIRLWLCMADCFRCGTSIELTAEQERQAARLLAARESGSAPAAPRSGIGGGIAGSRRGPSEATAQRSASPTPPAAQPGKAGATVPAARPEEPSPAGPAIAKQPTASRSLPTATAGAAVAASASASAEAARTAPMGKSPSQLPTRRVPAAEVYRGPRARVRQVAQEGELLVVLREWSQDLPAWIVSLLVHAVAMFLLGLLSFPPDDGPIPLVLATAVDDLELEGQQADPLTNDPKAWEFEPAGSVEIGPPPRWEQLEDDRIRWEFLEEPMPDDSLWRPLPQHAARPLANLTDAPAGTLLAGRDPKVRAANIERWGGTSETEAAVARGLKFLARHQRADGSWSFRFNHTADCDATCTGPGSSDSDVAATALALLPFLGAGQTHKEGQYAAEVRKGLEWLMAQQSEDGDLRGRGDGQMYAHGQAAIVLCEAYYMTGHPELRAAAQQAVNFIVRAQHSAGGWRYQPGQPGDTSVVGWQVMALKTAQAANLYAPARSLELAGVFLSSAQTDRTGARYSYMPGGGPTPAMTAEALLCRQFLGWPREHPGLQAGVNYLLEHHPPDYSRPNIYYWYYATQVMHHFGGKPWRQWNDRMRRLLLESQEKHGHAAGSWAPRGRSLEGGFADRGGRLYMTALAICCLEVYYRHLALYSEDVLQPIDALEGFK